jgi:hypothetical protein
MAEMMTSYSSMYCSVRTRSDEDPGCFSDVVVGQSMADVGALLTSCRWWVRRGGLLVVLP